MQGEVIRQGYRYAIAPSPAQEQFLTSCCGASRFWFNQGLALVKDRLDRHASGQDLRVPWSYKSLCSEFAPIKDHVCPWRSEVVVGSMQAGLEQVGRALQNYSDARQSGRRARFPRFRSKGHCHESVIFQRPRFPDARHVLLDRRLGPVRVKESMRKLLRLIERDHRARVVRSTVQRSLSGWFISFTVERSPKGRRPRRPGAVVGVDLGLARLATLSTGEAARNPRPLQAALRTLRRDQRQLDRQRRAANPDNYLPDGRVKSGPKTWTKSSRQVQTEGRIRRLHRRVANLRRENAHALTTYLTREFGVIGVETLAVKNLLANRRLARHISDVGWGMILRQLEYKTSWSDGSILIAADRFHPSSKTCSACGAVRAKLSLAERVFSCAEPGCGHTQDRDLNAAMNLANLAANGQRQGVLCSVAATGAETRNARRGLVRLDLVERSPEKREGSKDSSRRGDALALAIETGDAQFRRGGGSGQRRPMIRPAQLALELCGERE
jgi:putative transposase